jgi:hypothetical protein
MEPSMKHPSFKFLVLIPPPLFVKISESGKLVLGNLKFVESGGGVTVLSGQFKWGTFLLKGNGEVYKVG